MGNSDSKESGGAATRSSMPARSTSPRASSAPTLRSASISGDSQRNSHGSAGRASRAAPVITDSVEAGGIERGQQATEDATNQLSYWYLIKHGYNELVNLIIRPPRAEYDDDDLGPQEFAFGGRDYVRKDFVVVNDRRQTLQCSQWLPKEASVNGITEFPCVIYLHGNSSCRVEALSVLRTCLASGMTVVAFDCGGCGKSDGEYISLGFYEREDLKAVIEYLRSSTHVSTIGLWGRSMGAATALLHADRDPTIAGIVVDSAFTNLEQLVQEIVERGRREGYTIPGFAVKIVMKFIRSSVQKRANFDIKSLSPIDHASISFVPALFIAAIGDEFIAPHHSDQIYAQYAGDKNIVKVKGDHNTIRPQFLLDSAGIFLQTALHVDARLFPDVAATSTSRSRNRIPWSSSSPSSSWGLRMSDLDAAFSGGDNRAAANAPKEEWACLHCTYVNPPLRMQIVAPLDAQWRQQRRNVALQTEERPRDQQLLVSGVVGVHGSSEP
ncbi:Serine protease family s09x, partial [Globisporangium splendens]